MPSGGKRVGAGRPKADVGPSRAPPIERPEVTGLSAEELAKQHLDLAIATLSHISTVGVTESARVAAAKAIVEIAKGRTAEQLGKKEQAVAEAANAGKGSEWADDLDFETRPN